ncbi:MAG: ParB/RepB/Spo0J family partition protein [Chitinophagaceae bacterium]|nr:ParB/RepB/Spo0J family partition protein [Chitinophagaceae bacterium]
MTQPNKKDALGKGIRSLLQSIDEDLKTTAGQLKPTVQEAVTGVLRISVDDVEVNPKQPRHDFDEQAMQELADSIKMHDIIQPITVSKTAAGKYRLIAGERRWRASKLAGFKNIPAYIRQANDAELLELALLENLQRENLNAIEIGLSYKRLMDELGYTQEQVAERMGKDRTTVTNYIRLLKLPPDIQLAVRSGMLSMGHARALINIDTVDKQLYVYRLIKQKELSVRAAEKVVRDLYRKEPVKKEVKNEWQEAFRKIEDNLAQQYSTKVKVQHSKKGNGSITIEYFSLEQFNHILKQMGISVD